MSAASVRQYQWSRGATLSDRVAYLKHLAGQLRKWPTCLSPVSKVPTGTVSWTENGGAAGCNGRSIKAIGSRDEPKDNSWCNANVLEKGAAREHPSGTLSMGTSRDGRSVFQRTCPFLVSDLYPEIFFCHRVFLFKPHATDHIVQCETEAPRNTTRITDG